MTQKELFTHFSWLSRQPFIGALQNLKTRGEKNVFMNGFYGATESEILPTNSVPICHNFPIDDDFYTGIKTKLNRLNVNERRF